MIYHQGERFTLYHGDNRAILPTLPENSVDAIVTDPPYELGFMGKSWDASGVAFDSATWREAMRVLKPGGHLLAFSGSRTYHRIAVAIEDAGFEIRDQIMWLYGSGFPKSLDVSKAIDKAAGAEREVVGFNVNVIRESKEKGGSDYGGFTKADASITAPATAEAKQWQGWGTALKPAHEPIVVARKPLIGTVAANVLTYGTGGLNIDGARIDYANEQEKQKAMQMQSKPSLDIRGNAYNQQDLKNIENVRGDYSLGRWPANVIHDGIEEEWARFFYCAKTSKRDRNEGLEGFEEVRIHDGREEGGVGGSNPRNRTNNYRQNHHPTVKPTDLMRYLCRLVTPKGGIVLDPFAGSGSTGKAAIYEGFNFIGIEMTDEYLPIAKARIEFAINDREETLFDA